MLFNDNQSKQMDSYSMLRNCQEEYGFVMTYVGNRTINMILVNAVPRR